jgi:hypothetical protein
MPRAEKALVPTLSTSVTFDGGSASRVPEPRTARHPLTCRLGGWGNLLERRLQPRDVGPALNATHPALLRGDWHTI